METVYSVSSHNGMVAAHFSADKERLAIRATYQDGDISTSSYSLTLKKFGPFYQIHEIEHLSTPLDEEFGQNPDQAKVKLLFAVTQNGAINGLINHVVQPHKKPMDHSFPVKAEELKQSLEAILLN